MVPAWLPVRSLYSLTKGHNVDAVLAQRRSDRRGRSGLPRFQLQLDDGAYLLCHLWPSQFG